jgi:hypothetical protein
MKLKQIAVAVGAVALSGVAMAADLPGVAEIEQLKTDAVVYISAATAAVVVVAGGFWAISMIKRTFSKV